jgi:hypothetical protein
MITLENALWEPRLKVTPEFKWKNWQHYLDKPGALRGLLVEFALVRTIPRCECDEKECVRERERERRERERVRGKKRLTMNAHAGESRD